MAASVARRPEQAERCRHCCRRYCHLKWGETPKTDTQNYWIAADRECSRVASFLALVASRTSSLMIAGSFAASALISRRRGALQALILSAWLHFARRADSRPSDRWHRRIRQSRGAGVTILGDPSKPYAQLLKVGANAQVPAHSVTASEPCSRAPGTSATARGSRLHRTREWAALRNERERMRRRAGHRDRTDRRATRRRASETSREAL
jgi:hypothetical protein